MQHVTGAGLFSACQHFCINDFGLEEMGKLFKSYLDSEEIYRCNTCRTHLTSVADLESTDFSAGKHKAILVKSCTNITLGPAQDRQMKTGIHTVCDFYCIECESELGWKYLSTSESPEKYKEGKFILVQNKILKQQIPQEISQNMPMSSVEESETEEEEEEDQEEDSMDEEGVVQT